jgi:hypothetical protein
MPGGKKRQTLGRKNLEGKWGVMENKEMGKGLRLLELVNIRGVLNRKDHQILFIAHYPSKNVILGQNISFSLFFNNPF